MQIITRKGNFDSGHRVMNEARKCFHLHGHTYVYELSFAFEESEEIGYALDFKEIKRTYMQWIDDLLDHGMILNPKDEVVIETTKKLGTKLWLMSLNGEGEYCNPSVENIAKEVFLAMEVFTESYPLLRTHNVRIYETPNCFTDCSLSSIKDEERENWRAARYQQVKAYAISMGVWEYDDRKFTPEEPEPFTFEDTISSGTITITTEEDLKEKYKEENLLSLYDYLGHAAGAALGEAVYEEAKLRGVIFREREIQNRRYKGMVKLYPEAFLEDFFKK